MSRVYFVLIVVMLGLIVSACNSHTERPFEPNKLISHGQQVYVEYCAECHQMDGTGWSNLYPKLAGNPVVTNDNPVPVIVTVTYGQGSMMGFRGELTEEEIAAVISYIRNAWGNKAIPVDSRQIQ